jgi:methionyl-tRNA formyltransferase
MLTKADGAIDFARPAAAVAAHVRGVDPWPGAVAQLRGQPVKLFGPRVDDPSLDGGGRSGAVIRVDDRGAWIACRTGAVGFREMQLAGRRRMAARELAAGRAIAVGDVLSSSAAVDAPEGSP